MLIFLISFTFELGGLSEILLELEQFREDIEFVESTLSGMCSAHSNC